MFLIIGVFSVNFTHDAYACSCIALTEQEALEKSFASFVGVPIKIESPSGFNNIVTFQIERPIKNIGENITEITIITSSSSAACGYNFENNTRYLVHTFGEEGQRTIESGLCSGNKNLGFSSIPLLLDESAVKSYPESIVWYQFILYLVIMGIIIGVAVVWRKRK